MEILGLKKTVIKNNVTANEIEADFSNSLTFALLFFTRKDYRENSILKSTGL